MCGIAGIFNIKIQSRELRNKALRMARKIRHRGPDWSGMYCGGSAILAHERLSIVDPQSGGQPLYSSDRKQVLAVNGEIYNHRDIRAQYAGRYEFRTGSDCEVILALYRDKGIHFLEELNGIFAFALYDEEKNTGAHMLKQDQFVTPLLAWYDKNKREMVWRDRGNAYYTWISEIMLQQTRVEAVKGYYQRFLTAFPIIQALAEADPEQVRKCWELSLIHI